MKYVHAERNAIELNFMWLPTWLGQNAAFKKGLEEALSSRFVGRELTEGVLEEAHQAVIDFISKTYPIGGVTDFLDGIKYVEM